MRINLVSVEDSLMTVGLRKLISYTKSFHSDLGSYFIPLKRNRSIWRMLTGDFGDVSGLNDSNPEEIRRVAQTLAKSDIVGFSCMTGYADLAKAIMRDIKTLNPNAYIIWGGIHPIIHPEDAIQHADAICNGEGEYPLEEFITAWKEGKDFTKNPKLLV